MLFTYLQTQSFEDSGCLADGIPTLKCFEVVFNNVLMLVVALVIIILFAMIVYGAFQYMTARGEPEQVKKARSTITYAILGVILFMSSYLILNVIQLLFLGDPDEEDVPSLFKFEIPQFEAPGNTGSGTGGGTGGSPNRQLPTP